MAKKPKTTPDRAQVDPVTGAVLETPEIRALALADLRKAMADALAAGRVERWVRTDDQYLLTFLRARKHNVEAALDVIINFNRLWYKRADLVEGLCAQSCRKFQNTRMTQFLDGRDVHGNMVAALYMGAMKVGSYEPRDQLAFSLYTLAHLIEDEQTQLHGVTYVESMQGFSLSTAIAVGRSMDQKEQQELMKLPTDTFPMRIRGIYVTEQPWYFTFFWTIVKPFLHDKMVKRLRLFGRDFAALHALVPPSVLPPVFGGTSAVGFDDFLDRMEAREKETGMIGGFAVPFCVDDPTGERRKAGALLRVGAAASSESVAVDPTAPEAPPPAASAPAAGSGAP